ncbi:uncharacterized protein BHQ10_007256 [Talaromyces amestolkiae]|uniref:Uncharacterized protein n=1 Tax=Talaromyces amestolkiae TaxID=1196081 RepID=A0A364L616_TALAM|nr:uncharacterized protein BHQ10_007256 [Talaromyces amestolkiae]RAO71244.1 hypothetical protein BHQ10_007256 [Talaromyces amestolkiae]
MWSTALSNIFILPFLLLISIPLALSAFVTATLALTTLFVRALVVYFELVIALLAHFFLFPAHSPASGSFLALTEGSTPGIERTAHYARTAKYGHQHTGLVKSRRGSLSSKEGVAEDYFLHHPPQHGHAPIHSSHEALSSFISGNAERDFEGVGGWRTPLPRKKHHQTSSASSMSYNNSSEEELSFDHDDDEAWLSINKRLELPSRRFHVPSPMLSPKIVTNTALEDQARFHHQQQQHSKPQQRPRFHKRSKTSPLLSTQNFPSSVTTITNQQSNQPQSTQQLQTSKSSAGLDSLASPPRSSTSSLTTSSSSGWHDVGSPLLMTSSFSGLGADYKMVHYYHHQPLTGQRARRRSSGGSSSAAAKLMSLTGLGLT